MSDSPKSESSVAAATEFPMQLISELPRLSAKDRTALTAFGIVPAENPHALKLAKHDHRPVEHRTFQGFPISVENAAGTYRQWGKTKEELEGGKGRTLMIFDYGYIRRTMGEDGDQVDVYIGPNENASNAYVVRQLDPKTGQADEDKCFLGFNSTHEVRLAFLAHWDPENGPKAFGGITTYPVEEFREKVRATMKHPGAVKAFNPDQPRDAHGRFAPGGGGEHEGDMSISPMRMSDMTHEQREKERARLREVHARQGEARRQAAKDKAYRDAKFKAEGESSGRPLNSLKLDNVVDSMQRDAEGHAVIPETPRDQFATTLQDAVKGMPEELHNDLADKGYRVWAAPTCSSMFYDKERQDDMRNAIGFHNQNNHEIVVAKYAGDGMTLVRDPSDVLYHEAGHAVDVARSTGAPVLSERQWLVGKADDLSNRADFVEAQKADREAMSSSDRQRYGYFVDPKYPGEASRTELGEGWGEHRARQESFAQLFSDGMNEHLDMVERYGEGTRIRVTTNGVAANYSSEDPPPSVFKLSGLMPRTYEIVKAMARERGYFKGGKRAKWF